MSEKYKASRTLKSELMSLALVALVPIGIASVFPYQAVGYKLQENSQKCEAFASFVFLSETEEREAIARSRNAWQLTSRIDSFVQLELSMEDLPELPPSQLLDVPIIHEESKLRINFREAPLYPPSLAASPYRVEKLESSAQDRKYFSDEDLMKLK